MIKKLISDKARNLFILSQVGGIILTLVLGKIIAVYFLPKEFGDFNLEFGTYTFFFSLLISPFLQFIKTNLNTFIPKVSLKNFYILLFLLIIVFYLLASSSLILFLSSSYHIFWILSIMIPANILYNFSSDFFNLTKQLKLFSALNFTKTLLPLVFLAILYFMTYRYSNGANILWVVQIFGFVITIIFFLPKIHLKKTSSYQVSFKKFFFKYLKFAWPLILLSFWSWINNYIDRYVINYYMDSTNVGIYNANYALGSKFFLFLSPLFLTLLTPSIYSNNKITEKKTIINKYAKLYVAASIIILILVYILKDIFGMLLLSKLYKDGFYLIFWTATSYFFLTVVFLFETVFYALGKTKIILSSNVVSAVINIILNLILVPMLGLIGAALATLFSFIFRFIIIYIYYQKL